MACSATITGSIGQLYTEYSQSDMAWLKSHSDDFQSLYRGCSGVSQVSGPISQLMSQLDAQFVSCTTGLAIITGAKASGNAAAKPTGLLAATAGVGMAVALAV